MAQVMNPNVKRDNTLDTVLSGLKIYGTVSDLSSQKQKDDEEKKKQDEYDAMKRRLDAMYVKGQPEP